jgi:hypothetical protein
VNQITLIKIRPGRKSVEPTFDSDSSAIDICKYLFFVLCILLIISGIEINPGPSVASESSSSFSSAESLSSNMSNLMTNSVSFLHLNIQSSVPKLDLIIAEYSCHDILSFTESWLKPDISTDSLKLPCYKPPYRINMVDRLGGGVVVFVRDEINCVTRLDLQVGSVECTWLEIKINNKKYLYGTFNMSPNSGQQIWEELEQSIYLALNSNHDIIITGDFNINQFGKNTTKTDNLLAQFSFHQLITEPTYVIECSSSLLYLVFKISFNPPFL